MLDTSRPSSRILAALELLQDHPGITGPQLADRLDVSGRTVRRYITTLQDMGIPVQTSAGRLGGYALMPGFRLPPLMFNSEEALGLALALLTSRPHRDVELPKSVEGALAKIERVLPRELLEQVSTIREQVVLPDSEDWDVATFPNPEVVSRLAQARMAKKRVYIRYSRPNGEESGRAVDPYGIAAMYGRWYLLGWCHLRKDRRTFRIDRIRRVDIERDTFEVPEGLDVIAQVERSLATAWGEHKVELILDLPLEDAQCQIPRQFAVLEAMDDGRTRLTASTSNVDWFASRLAFIESEFTVVHPPELRDALRRLADRLARAAADSL